ncbi:Oxidoreductase protein [Thalictrum thalictroides]|uniref:Oxidoreductase protein n=1 Tax=Thalictrum thalictroides TaxID=46969 RepID=A0A7J6UWX8_THATH|nr:Oxidoreductase protein [Thalictrum thalictroides]
MADQSGRQPFRFRIPWVMYTTPTAPRPQPTTSIRPPPTQPQPQLTQPTTSVRPPFRPAGVAAPRLPSPPQVPSRTDSQPSSPARTAASTPPSPDKTTLPIRSAPRLSSQPPSPSKTASSQLQVPSKTESQPASPTRTTPKSQASSQPSSPSIPSLSPSPTPPTTSIPSLTTPKSQIPSPSPTSKTQSETQTSSQPSSPSLIRNQPHQVDRPPSPSHRDSQMTTHTSSQPPSPSYMVSQVEAATQKKSQPQSPLLQASQLQPTAQKPSPPPSPPMSSAFQTDLPSTKSQPVRNQPHQVYRPPSPSHRDSQMTTQTSSQPPSPSYIVSQVGAATQRASQPQSPLLQASQLQPTAQKPSPPPSPSMSSAFQTDLPSTKSQPKMSKLPSKDPFKAEGSSGQVYQPDQKRQPQLGSPAVLVDPRQHQAPESKAEEKMKDNSTILVEEEKKQRPIPDFIQMASVSNTQHKGQLNTSEEEKQQRRKHAGTHEKDMIAKVATGKESNPVVPNTQKAMHASTDYHPLAPQGEISNLHKEIRDDISKFTHKMSVDHPEKTIDENPVSVVTLTGENRGASMQIGPETAKKDSSVRIHRGYKLNHGDISEATTDGESSAKPSHKESETGDDTAQTLYINSNTQSVNNSIVQNSSINERNPGVHMVFTNNTTKAMKSNKNTSSVETRKADFNITQPQKLTYEPTVKRRCLRGLLLESSDSDPDNPNKPRRHGCRYDCREKQNGNDQ